MQGLEILTKTLPDVEIVLHPLGVDEHCFFLKPVFLQDKRAWQRPWKIVGFSRIPMPDGFDELRLNDELILTQRPVEATNAIDCLPIDGGEPPAPRIMQVNQKFEKAVLVESGHLGVASRACRPEQQFSNRVDVHVGEILQEIRGDVPWHHHGKG